VQPLVTQHDRGFVRCASTNVFVLPESLEGAVAALDRIALPNTAAVPVRAERIPTDKIAVIGDLPPSAELVSLDLRAGGRRGLWMFATAAVAIVAAAAGVLVHASTQPTSTVAVQQPREALVDESLPAPPPAIAPTHVEAAVPAAPPVTPAKAPPPVPAKHAQPAAIEKPAVEKPAVEKAAVETPVAVPAELQPAEDDDDSCSQDSCARHHNERECCTPFRNEHVAKLDRAAIARATAGLKAKVRECRDPQVTDGAVRVSIDVAPDGSVTGASVLQAPEAGVGQCVADVLRTVTFAATDEGGTFVYRADLAAD
jgi:outer membrane biosynthesis protein TonB